MADQKNKLPKEQKVLTAEIALLVSVARQNIRKELLMANPSVGFNETTLNKSIDQTLFNMTPKIYKIYQENIQEFSRIVNELIQKQAV